MPGFIRWIGLPDGRQGELDNGVATVWDGVVQQYHGLYDNLPDDVLRYLRQAGVLRIAHYD